MKRSVLAVWLSMLICLLAMDVANVMAQSFPDRPIQVIVANVPGSIMDINARTVTEELTEVKGD
jgi:tripartite-type tricarboxylate transporter receptor subunit TctC